MVGGDMLKQQCHHFIVTASADQNAAFAFDLPDHESFHRQTPYGFKPNS